VLNGHSEPVEYTEVARAESERGEVVLRERRPEDGPSSLELRVNGVYVMDNVEVSTERALAREALSLVADPRAVIVGGLGLGFTMHEVLADSRVELCSVVEIEQALVDWMRDGTVPEGPALLADARVNVVVADVAAALAEARPATYDLVLLDVDNGPANLVHVDNAALYERPTLELARGVLRPGGALVVWSADEAPALEATMGAVFDEVEVRSHEVRLQERDEHYWLYVARVASEG
jgi:spermidine synthase